MSFLSGRAGGGGSSAGLSKSYQARREALFTPRDFTVLGNYQAIAQVFDGKAVADAVRCYLFPDYLVEEARPADPVVAGEGTGVVLMIETQASLAEVGEHLADLRQFIGDDSVSEIVVNGPGRLYVEREAASRGCRCPRAASAGATSRRRPR